MSFSIGPDLVVQAFDDAVCSTVGHLAGFRPRATGAPALLSAGTCGEIEIRGGWNGIIAAHCDTDAVKFLVAEMSTILIDRPHDPAEAVVETLLESVANAFMHRFVVKSEVLSPQARPWSLGGPPEVSQRTKSLHRIACDLPVGVFTFSLACLA